MQSISSIDGMHGAKKILFMIKSIKSKVIKYGDNINTDVIFPGRYLALTENEEIAEHAMEDLDPNFKDKVNCGKEIVVAGRNFGCGSSREQAALCLKESGVKAVIACSFARIFYRNAINIGLPAIEIDRYRIDEGDELEIDLESSRIINSTKGESINFEQMPGFIMEILEAGGLLNYATH